jgi:hypothetical protein
MIPSIQIKELQSHKTYSAFIGYTYVLASPYKSVDDLIICFPSLHRLHLNVSCVSHCVFSLNKNSCRRASKEKCRSVFSFSSTTADDSACFDACRWNIFSSIVPVEMKRYTKPTKHYRAEKERTKNWTYTLSFDHRAKHGQEPAGLRQDSNLSNENE